MITELLSGLEYLVTNLTRICQAIKMSLHMVFKVYFLVGLLSTNFALEFSVFSYFTELENLSSNFLWICDVNFVFIICSGD